MELGALVVNELVARSGIPPKEFDSVVFGQVIPSPTVTLIGREMVLRTQLPRSVQAHTVARACATSIQTTTDAADQIRLGHSDCAISGGAESLSDAPIFATRALAQALVELSRADARRPRPILSALRPKDFAPQPPALKEPTTGLTMGESAELMAQKNGISREAQDRVAYESHRRAAAAWESGKLDGEVMHVPVPPGVRADRVEGQRRPQGHDPRGARGAAAGVRPPVRDHHRRECVAAHRRRRRARAHERGEGARARSAPSASCDRTPTPRSTRATSSCREPAYAAPVALDRAGLRLADMDLVDMHEAFAAQVLSNLKAFASKDFAEGLGRSEPLGEIDPARLNVNGGSIAIGHPFAATGARMILQTLRELERRKGQHALITVCAAGALGALVLERE